MFLPNLKKSVKVSQVPQASKVLLFLFILLSLLVTYYLLLARSASAQVPDPYVPCSQDRNEEFHSLRPYQASPCNENVQDEALFCGNDLVLTDSITVSKSQASSCTGDVCSFTVDQSKEVAIDLSGADLPIAGLTGNGNLVINSQDQPEPEGADDSLKVNEYLSWYVNGVINRAEYPFLDDQNEDDVKKLTTLSGPVKKTPPMDNSGGPEDQHGRTSRR